jgi:hypothetical protein
MTTTRAATAFRAFKDAVTAQGGEVLEASWKGARVGHPVRCAAGHDCTPRPNNVANGQGICIVCGGRSSMAAWAEFKDRVAAQGGEVLATAWVGKDRPHRVRCAFGHIGQPTPGSVQRGNGICHTCAHRVWDAFYVVRRPGTDTLKFGITSGSPRARLADHARDGFTDVLRSAAGLPTGEAKSLEDELRLLLRCAGVVPVRGREYFSDAVAPVVLSVVDEWLSPA